MRILADRLSAYVRDIFIREGCADDEAERIGVSSPEDALVYVTVRSAPALEDFCANLRAPILVVGNQGHQVINQAQDAPVRAPLFAGLQEEPSTKAA